MPVHEVQPGECLSSIAKDYGFSRWQTIYDAPENSELKKKRPNPNVLFPGDEITIPERRLKEEAVATGQEHRFKKMRSKTMFRIEMKDDGDRPYEGYPFKLYVNNELVLEDETQADGLIEVPIRDDARSGVLEFLGDEIQLRFGKLDPVTVVRGIQQRLNNLGFYAGSEDAEVGEKLTKAVYAFQRAHDDLEATGVIDDEFRKQLLIAHDADEDAQAAEEDMSGSE